MEVEEDEVQLPLDQSQCFARPHTQPPTTSANMAKRQPRPRKDYHKKIADLPDRLRIPNDLADRFLALRQHLQCSNGDVIRWLFQKSQVFIDEIMALCSTLPSLPAVQSSSANVATQTLVQTNVVPSDTLLPPHIACTAARSSLPIVMPTMTIAQQGACNEEDHLSDLDDDPDVVAAADYGHSYAYGVQTLGNEDPMDMDDEDDCDSGGLVGKDIPESESEQDPEDEHYEIIGGQDETEPDQGDHIAGQGDYDLEAEPDEHEGHTNNSGMLHHHSDDQRDNSIWHQGLEHDEPHGGEAGSEVFPHDSHGQGDHGEDDNASHDNEHDPLPTEPPQGGQQVGRRKATYAFVAKKKLLEFFTVFTVICPLDDCDARCTCQVREWGLCFTVTLVCGSGHRSSWQSGETELNTATPAVAARLYCAILSAGLSCTQLQEMCRTVGLHQPSHTHFYRFQSGKDRDIGWCAAVLATWEEQKFALQMELATAQVEQERINQGLADEAAQRAQQAEEEAQRTMQEAMQEADGPTPLQWQQAAMVAESVAVSAQRDANEAAQLAAESHGITVMVDARFDSSRSGYHGTAPILEYKSGYCIEMVTHTRVEDNGSWNIEDRVVAEGLENLQARGVHVIEAVHDDKTSVDAILARMGIQSQKDLWHKTKKLMKKFKDKLEDAKRKVGNEILPETTEADLRLKTNKALQAFLREKKLAVSGNKEQLVQRCMIALGLGTSGSEPSVGTRGGGSILAYPVFSRQDMAYKFKSWFYVCCTAAAKRRDRTSGLLCCELANVAEHWAGNHELCAMVDPTKKCVVESFGEDRAYFSLGSPEYVALTKWLAKHITRKKMAHYIRARENFLSETYHSLINKYASKRIHWRKSHLPRLACAALDWNENRARECIGRRQRTTTDTAVRRRPATYRILTTKTEQWKDIVATKIFGEQPPSP